MTKPTRYLLLAGILFLPACHTPTMPCEERIVMTRQGVLEGQKFCGKKPFPVRDTIFIGG